jgi:hypothetical protein
MEIEREGMVVYYIPTMIRTLLLITNSYNVRCSFLLVSRYEQYQTFGKVNGLRGVPRGVTQLCITNIQSEFRMYLKFNPRATEVFTARIIHDEFYPFHVMLLYLSAYNIYIDRPLTLFNLCLAQAFSMGYNSQNVTPFHAPLTVRRQLYFPIRRTIRFIDSSGDINFSCTQCAVEAYNFNIDV